MSEWRNAHTLQGDIFRPAAYKPDIFSVPGFYWLTMDLPEMNVRDSEDLTSM